MTGLSRSPRILKGGLVLMDRTTGKILRTIDLQYNPEMLTRSLTVRGAGDDSDPVEALRLAGPPVETISLEAVLDAADGLEEVDEVAKTVGVAADIAALETVIAPSAATLAAQDALAERGSIEILPAVASLVLFVWGAKRIVPVRITEFSVTEEAFDPNLNPIRAKISLGLRALTINDLNYGSRGGALSLVQLRMRETLATRARGGGLAALGAEEDSFR